MFYNFIIDFIKIKWYNIITERVKKTYPEQKEVFKMEIKQVITTIIKTQLNGAEIATITKMKELILNFSSTLNGALKKSTNNKNTPFNQKESLIEALNVLQEFDDIEYLFLHGVQIDTKLTDINDCN